MIANELRPSPQVAVVIPCYRVANQIMEVLKAIGPEVSHIICVDDACPEGSAALIERENHDPRVAVIRHAENQGVGGAMVTGYRAALAAGVEIVVKVDGDGQMDPRLIGTFIGPILSGRADYTKGNRFYNLDTLYRMPRIRLFGNAALSFLTKFSSGYWEVFDPTNGFTAVHAAVLRQIPLATLSRGYFFESDFLFRLNIVKATVVDIPMQARYGNEQSSLRISRVAGEFLVRHFVNTFKRFFYNYFLRDFSVASIQLVLGATLLAFGLGFGISKWIHYSRHQLAAPTGTVMVATLTVLIGIQLLLSFLNFDMRPSPREALYRRFTR